MLEINQIYCGDCFELLKELPDKAVDLVLTDPPFGNKIQKPDGTVGGGDKRNQAIPYPLFRDERVENLSELIRISKNQIIWGGEYYAKQLPVSRGWIVWLKRDGMNSVDFSDCELAWTSYDRAIKTFFHRWNGFIRDSERMERYHPTQKPVKLMEWCLLNYSQEGDLILDPFMGSGSVIIACIRTNRRYIGIEIVPEYYEIAKKRIEMERLSLFEGG